MSAEGGAGKAVGVGCAAMALIVAIPGILIAVILATSMQASQAAPGFSSAQLDPSKVPAPFVSAVQAAGSLCPEVSAPAIAAQIEQESAWNPLAVNPSGAQGIAQFMPQTWKQFGGGASPFDPQAAIMAQGKYMCSLAQQMQQALGLKTVQGDILSLTLAAYNAGPYAVTSAHGVPPNPETQNYVSQILSGITKYALQASVTGALGAGTPALVDYARQWMGYPYVWGGGTISGPSGIGRDGRGPGFDCSGLVLYSVYHALGIQLNHLADSQIFDPHGTLVATKPGRAPANFAGLQPGDVIGFSENGSGLRGSFGHIAIYVGNGQMIEAPQTGDNVKIAPLAISYWERCAWRIVRFHK